MKRELLKLSRKEHSRSRKGRPYKRRCDRRLVSKTIAAFAKIESAERRVGTIELIILHRAIGIGPRRILKTVTGLLNSIHVNGLLPALGQ